MEPDKVFLIYQLIVTAEADRLGLIDHNAYIETIQRLLKSFANSDGEK